MKYFFIIGVLLPTVFGYGVITPTPELGHKPHKEKVKVVPPIEHLQKAEACHPSTIIKVDTTTQIVPSYVTETVDKYITETLEKFITETKVEKITEVKSEIITSIIPSYITETAYKTEYSTNIITETKYETKIVPTKEVVFSTIYVTNTEQKYVTVTEVVKPTVTKAVLKEAVKEIEKYVPIKHPDEHEHPKSPIKGGYGK